jgi:L-ascorbate metabolism protein UlaG (beta-lactamase superfamily)
MFLKPNVAAKPLLNHWPLWPQLIPPASAAMVVAKVHASIMNSYLAVPSAHAEACQKPGLRGGPWVNYEKPRLSEIRELLSKTQKLQAPLFELAAALQTLDDLLRREAKGFSLESLYASVPAPLRGMVELVYDTNNQPGVRILEGVAYASAAYQPELQQVELKLVDRDWLPYERSTPVLDDGNSVFLNMPFADARLDRLFETRDSSREVAVLAEELGVRQHQLDMFGGLFTHERAETRYVPPDAGEVRIRYMGHAAVLMESREVSILTDPFLSYEYPNSVPRYTFEDLPPRLDYVLISHVHSDHLHIETLLRLRSRVQTIVVPRASGRKLQDPSLKALLERLGFKNVVELDVLETINVAGGCITAVPFLGEHGDLDIHGKAGYHVALDERTALFLADACNIDNELYRRLRHILGVPDALFVGMECEGAPLSWMYGPVLTRKLDRLMDQSRRLRGSNAAEAAGIVEHLRPKRVYVYAMGQEPWLNHVLAINQEGDHPGIDESNRFVAQCRALGLEAERLFGSKELVLR